MKFTPFAIESLKIGEIIEKNRKGVFGSFPPTIENSFGFRIGGLKSHKRRVSS